MREKLATVPGLPPVAADGIATAMESSAGQALTGIRAQPGTEQIVPLLDQAFVDAARLTGFAAVVFVLLGLGFSVLLPETRTQGDDGRRRGATRAAPDRRRARARRAARAIAERRYLPAL